MARVRIRLKTMLVNGNRGLQVVGIVADVRHVNCRAVAGPEFYLSILQRTTMSPSLVVRTGPPVRGGGAGTSSCAERGRSDLPTAGFRPLQQIVDRATLAPALLRRAC